MTLGRLALRGLIYYWRTGLAAVLCLALASAVIVGSMLVGVSVRSALLTRFVRRIGPFRHAVSSTGFFATRVSGSVPALQLSGSLTDERGALVPAVSVWGIDDWFDLRDGEAVVSDGLARDLGVASGSRVFMRLRKPTSAPAETLFGRRSLDESTIEIPVTVRSVESSEGFAGLSIRPAYAAPRNLFVRLSWLQRQLRLNGKANLLLSHLGAPSPSWSIEDLGLEMAGAVVHSRGLLVTDDVVEACRQIDRSAVPTSVGLATQVRNGERTIAYAMVASVGPYGPQGDEAWVNEWAVRDLGAKPGDRLSLRCLIPRRDGSYATLESSVVVRRTIPVVNVPRGLVPELDGLTDSSRIGDWKPPFPVDLSRVTPRDEEYWKRYRATPRILLSDSALRQIWGGGRFVTGVSTSVSPSLVRTRLPRLLRPSEKGIESIDLLSEAKQAARGSSDLGALMLMLSVVVVFAALTLAGSVMALNVRARQQQLSLFESIGARQIALKAVGTEGAVLAIVGAGAGVPLGIGFASVALALLRRFMPSEASLGPIPVVPALPELALGFVAASLCGSASAWLAVRRATLSRRRERVGRMGTARRISGRWGAGTVFRRTVLAHRGRFAAQAVVSFAAAFVLAAVAGNVRSGPPAIRGFSLVATSTAPVDIDFGTSAGRARLRFDEGNEHLYEGMRVVALRQSPGDDSSCLNPAKPSRPRLVGVPKESNGIVAGWLGYPEASLENETPGKPAPAVGDSESVEWILQSGVGRTFETGHGKVRFAAVTHGTALAGQILVSERAFRGMFPAAGGPSLFLIATARPAEVARALRQDLAEAGIDVRSASEQVAALHGVQNAYLSIFLCLGMVGTLLGTVGAALLALRSAAERRGELALLSALGFSRSFVAMLLSSESVTAVAAGLLAGTGAALLVVRGSSAAWIAAGTVGTWVATVLACAVVATMFLRSGLLEALRSE